jgi:diguanylate cyclase (GGDEF)-like protein
MNMPKFRAALIVFLVGFALGLTVFAASRLFVRSVLTADATAAAEELARRLADGSEIEATGPLSIISRYTHLDATGAVVKSASLRSSPQAEPGAGSTEMASATESARSGKAIVTHAPLFTSLLGLTEPAVRSVSVPVISEGRITGSVSVQVDQAAALPALSEAFSLVGIVTVGLAVLAVVLIGFALRRGERGAFHTARLPLDTLTGVPTRQGFEAALANAVERAGAAEHQIGLMIVDLDDFRKINHIWGHAAGDAVLKSAAERLRALASGPASLARISGDHFALMVEGDANPLSLRQWAEKVNGALRVPFDVGGSSIAVGASIGAALFPIKPDNPDMLFRAADTALSKAKGNRGEPVAFFDTDMKRKLQRRADTGTRPPPRTRTRRVRRLLSAAAGTRVGPPARLRSAPPVGAARRRILPTAEFLSVAEETGLIRPLGDWVCARPAGTRPPGRARKPWRSTSALRSSASRISRHRSPMRWPNPDCRTAPGDRSPGKPFP